MILQHVEHGNVLDNEVAETVRNLIVATGVCNPDSILEGLNLSTFRQKRGTSLTTILGKRLSPFLPEQKKAELLKKIRELYPIEGRYKLSLYSPQKFDNLIVEDSRSCFRSGGSNRGHFRALVYFFREKGDIIPYYALIEKDGTSLTRAWCWIYRTEKIAVLHNFYGAYSMQMLRFPLAHMLSEFLELDINDVKLAIKDGNMPVYTNDDILIIYPSVYYSDEAWEKFREGYIHCPICHDAVPLQSIAYEGGTVGCYYCLGEEVDRCFDCEEIFRVDNLIYIEAYDRYVCSHCFDEHYNNCSDCGEAYLHRDLTYIEAELFCEHCLENFKEKEMIVRCKRCGSWLWKKNSYFVGDQSYCKGCYYDGNL